MFTGETWEVPAGSLGPQVGARGMAQACWQMLAAGCFESRGGGVGCEAWKAAQGLGQAQPGTPGHQGRAGVLRLLEEVWPFDFASKP